MAFSPETATRIRQALSTLPESFEEKRMFGGLSFLYKGKMTIGIVGDELAVRVVEKRMSEALKNQHARPMDFTKRPMKEFIFVATPGFETEKQLMKWIEMGLEHAKAKVEK